MAAAPDLSHDRPTGHRKRGAAPLSRRRGRDDAAPLYAEILALLEPEHAEEFGGAVLIGDHTAPDADAHALDDPLLGDVVRRIVAKWPPPPLPLNGRDVGGRLRDWSSALDPVDHEVRRAFGAVLARCLRPAPRGQARRSRSTVPTLVGKGVLPNAADRLAPARRRLGAAPTLWEQTAPAPARLATPAGIAHLYVDVSGSMQEELPALLSLLLSPVARGAARAFQFSGPSSNPCPSSSCAAGDSRPQGTSIDCVLEHLLARPLIRRALVLTDGYVGEPEESRPRPSRRRASTRHPWCSVDVGMDG